MIKVSRILGDVIVDKILLNYLQELKTDLDLVEIYGNHISIYLDIEKGKIKRELKKLIKLNLIKNVFYSKSSGIIFVNDEINDKILKLNNGSHYYRLEL